jgi:predicted nucleic acid-binding protein
MTLADTSVSVEHFRRGHAGLRKLLEEGEIVIHPFVYGELACGHLPGRAAPHRAGRRLGGFIRDRPAEMVGARDRVD